MIRSTVLTIGENRGTKRIWIEGKYLKKAGFEKGNFYDIVYNNNNIQIFLDDISGRKITERRDKSVIDITNSKINSIFKGETKVNVIVEIEKIIVQKIKTSIRKLTAPRNKKAGGIFNGGGLLDLAAEKNNYKMVWGVESNVDYANVWQSNFGGEMFNCDIAEVDYSKLEPVELLLAGIPCTPYSQINYSNREKHPDLDASLFFLVVVEKLNPRTIILEEVPGYLKSQVGIATIKALERLGYNVEHKIMCGKDYNELTSRTRLVIIASYDKITWIKKEPHTVKVKDVLLKPSHPKCKWFTPNTKKWFFKKGKGNFVTYRQIITKDTEFINTLPKKYLESQPQNPIVKHPTKKNTFRLLTAIELRKIAGVPDSFHTGPDWITGHVVGNGVLVKLFTKIIGGMVN